MPTWGRSRFLLIMCMNLLFYNYLLGEFSISSVLNSFIHYFNLTSNIAGIDFTISIILFIKNGFLGHIVDLFVLS